MNNVKCFEATYTTRVGTGFSPYIFAKDVRQARADVLKSNPDAKNIVVKEVKS